MFVDEDRVDSRFDTDDLRTRDSYIAGVDKLRYEGCCRLDVNVLQSTPSSVGFRTADVQQMCWYSES